MATAHTAHPRRARYALAAVGAATAMLLTACGTSPGSAADVAGVSVPTDVVLDRAHELLTMASSDIGDSDVDMAAQAARTQVTAFIRHQLVEEAAARDGVTVTEADVNDFAAQYDSYQTSTGGQSRAALLGVSEDMADDATYDLLVLDALAGAMPEGGADVTDVTVTVDVVPAESWADAVAARVRYLDDPAAMTADAAEALATNPGLPTGQESLIDSPHHGLFGIFSAADGEILLIANGDGSYLVTRITNRVESPAKLTADKVNMAYQVAGITGQFAVTSLLLADIAESTEVHVNPRFGKFDPRIVQVVATQ